MLWGLFVLLACQTLGEAIAQLTDLPLPGPVVGMVVLMALLGIRDGKSNGIQRLRESVENTSFLLLRNLSLLFIPAGAGVIGRYDLFAEHGFGLAVTVIASTVITLIATALIFVVVARLTSRKGATANE